MTAGWDSAGMYWGQWGPVDVTPGHWSYVHPPGQGEGFFLSPGQVGGNLQDGSHFYIWKGTADTIPFPNGGKPLTTGTVIGPLDGLGIARGDGSAELPWPPGGVIPAGETWLTSNGAIQLIVATNEACGVLDLSSLFLPPPVVPPLPTTVQFPPEVEATLADIQVRIRALEAKLDRLIPMADLRLPRVVDGWTQELVAGDVSGVDVYTVAADGFLVDLTTIPASAGSRPGPVPLYEVNARALQLGWVAWTETSDEPGWKWQRLDMAKTWVAALEGTVESVEVSLAPGVVADLYKLIRHYA